MDLKIQHAFHAGIAAYTKVENIEHGDFEQALQEAFNQDVSFMDKVNALDKVFDDYPDFEELREIYFDLLMMNFFASDVQKLEEDYLDSPEWETIEEQTIDRGTELLNIFLYLKECADDEVTPSLEDYLKEFLLVEEDEFQDEYNIYEQVIANQILADSTYGEIAKVTTGLDAQDELKELFYPVMSFFNDTDPSAEQLEAFKAAAPNKSLDTAIYAIIVNFNK